MKKIVFVGLNIFCGIMFHVSAQAIEENHPSREEKKIETSEEAYVTRNPFTKTTTQTTIQNSKAEVEQVEGKVVTEESYKVEEQHSDDGKKVKVKTEETFVEEKK